MPNENASSQELLSLEQIMYVQRSALMVGLSMLVLARGALAATGMAGLDTTFRTIDTGIGAAGYIFFATATCIMLVSFMTGHTYVAFGVLGIICIGGAIVGNRVQLGGVLGLALADTLDPSLPLLLDMFP
jgi:hypothetical protein